MLGWAERASPCDERAADLKRFFAKKGALPQAFQKLLQNSEQRLKAVMNDRFLQLLGGQLEIDPAARWTIQAVSSFLQSMVSSKVGCVGGGSAALCTARRPGVQ